MTNSFLNSTKNNIKTVKIKGMDSWHELEAKFDEGEKVDLSFLGIPNKDEDEEEEARYTLIGSSFSTFTRTCRIALMAKNAVFDQVSYLLHTVHLLSNLIISISDFTKRFFIYFDIFTKITFLGIYSTSLIYRFIL